MKKITALLLCVAICFSLFITALTVSAAESSACDLNSDGRVTIADILAIKKAMSVETAVAENAAAKIIDYNTVGDWVDAKTSSASVGPEKAFDGNVSTMWNPQANKAATESEEAVVNFGTTGIVFALDDVYTLTNIAITVKTREYFFDAYVSSDNVDFVKVASITSDNYTDYYNDAFVCTINNINKGGRFVKLVFTGNIGEFESTHVNLCEVAFAGSIYNYSDAKYDINGDNSVDVCDILTVSKYIMNRIDDEDIAVIPVSSALITGHSIEGSFLDNKSADAYKAYDNNTATKWNAQTTGYGKGWIVFELKNATDLTSATITFDSRRHYIDLYASADGTNYTKIASVDANNYSRYYDNTNRIITLSRIHSADTKYVKVVITGNESPTVNTYTNFKEISLSGREKSTTPPDTREEVKAAITGYSLAGTYTDNRVGKSNPPESAYDGNVSTKWNPNGSYSSTTPSEIVFNLDNKYNITKLALTFASRKYYFDAYVSSNGETWTQVASVLSDVAANYYTDYVATIDGLNTDAAKYVKIIFRGNEGTVNTFINFQEIEVFGKAVPDTREVVKSSITGYSLAGTYTDDRVGKTNPPESAYDGNVNTKWNPNGSYSSTTPSEIVFNLDDEYNITKLALTFASREYYFDAYVSNDGVTWTQVASVLSAVATDYYTDYVATIDGLNTDAARYVKIIFRGNEGTANTFINFQEIEVFGKVVD